MEICEVCGKEVRIMTPPGKGVCSENCLKMKRESRKKHHSNSDTPRPQRGTHNY